MSKFFQGDIKLDPELEEYIRNGANSRNAIRSRKRLWTSRIIPYRIPSYMSMYLWIISCSCLRMFIVFSGIIEAMFSPRNKGICTAQVKKVVKYLLNYY